MGLGARQQFGRYVAVDSHLHSLDPLAKVAGFIVLVVSIFLVSSWPAACLLAVYIAVLAVVSRVRLSFYAESLKYFTWMLALSFAINVIFPRAGRAAALTPDSLEVAAIMAVRLALMVVAAAIFTVATSPSEIGDCAMVFARLRGPIGRRAAEFAMVLAISLRFVPVVFEEAERVKAAQSLRGTQPRGLVSRVRAVARLVVPLLESSLRRAGNLGFAMDARCYGYRLPAARRTRFSWDEAVFAASLVVLLGLTLRLR
jgi:energy-coupling factor transport system permease protein